MIMIKHPVTFLLQRMRTGANSQPSTPRIRVSVGAARGPLGCFSLNMNQNQV